MPCLENTVDHTIWWRSPFRPTRHPSLQENKVGHKIAMQEDHTKHNHPKESLHQHFWDTMDKVLAMNVQSRRPWCAFFEIRIR